MDTTVWVQADESADSAGAGDVVVTPADDIVKVGDVLEDGTVAWRAEVEPALLPGLPDAGDQPQRITDPEVLRAIDGVLVAERNRGG